LQCNILQQAEVKANPFNPLIIMKTLGRKSSVLLSSLTIATVLAALLALTTQAQTTARQALRGHRALPAAARAQAVDRLAPTQQLQFNIGLPLRNQAELTQFLQELSDPASPNYRKFLTPEQFTERFGPTAADYQAVLAYVRANGFTVTATHPNRVLVSVSAPVAAVEKAFHVTMRHYKHPTEARNFFAPDAEPTLDLAVPIQDIGGLDDYIIPHPADLHVMPADATPQNGSAWHGGYMGSDFRNAYAPDVTLTGAGQSAGTINFAGYIQSDVRAYQDMNSIPHIPIVEELLDGVTNITNNPDGETVLDLDMLSSMAPGLNSIYFYRGTSIDTMLSAIASDNVAKQIGASWLYGTTGNTDNLLQQLAAEGITFFNAVGDYCAYPAPGHPTLPDCAGTPYVTAVGGTTLTMNGTGASYASEKVWNWYSTGQGAGGASGGISPDYTIPFWQQGIDMTANHGSTTMRNTPDVALTADNIYVYDSTSGTNTIVGGESCATPLWAGFMALINEQNALNSNPPIGALNPIVYAIGKSSAYTAAFHDITVGNNTNTVTTTNYPAVPGYDLCTGWGTPKGQATINAITVMPYLASVPPTTLNAYTGSNVSLTVSAGGQPTLVYQWQYDGNNISGANGATLNLANLQPTNSGLYRVIVTNNFGAVTSTVCALTVIALPPYPNQALATGPVAYYRLNETSGTTAYDSVGGYNGTNSSGLVLGVPGPTAPAFPGFESGNTAYQFNGTNTSVSVPALNLNTNTVTITAWVNCNATEGYYPGIFAWQGGGSARGQFLFGNGNNKLGSYWNGSFLTSTLVVPTNQWSFVALVVSPANTVIYMATNSTLAAWTNTAANQAAAFTNTAYIGTSPYGSYTGGIDEVAVYNQSLTGSQIASLLSASLTALPVVTLTAPTNGSFYVAPAAINLTASVVTNGHSIQKVQFFNGASLLAESTTPPYQYTFNSVPHGLYTLLAEVVYDGGSVLGSLPANVTVTNLPPIAVADATNTLKNTAVTINVLANDSDPNGYALTLQSVTQPANGTAAISGTNILYTPTTGFTGTDTFTYTIFDGYFDTATATVTVTVNQPQPPTLVNDTATTTQNTPVTIPVLANDTDPYNLPLSIQSVTQPARGIATIAGTNVVYTPNNYWYGLDTFTYTATDGYGPAATATVTVTTPFTNYASTYTNAVLSTGPVAYWRLNETSGTTAYDAIGGHNGTDNGSLVLGVAGPTPAAWPGFESANTAYQFSSNSASATSVSLPALNLTSNITLTAWVKPNAAQGYYPGIVTWSSGGNTLGLVLGNYNNQLGCVRNGLVYSSSSLQVPANQWSLVALTMTPTNAILYLATNSALVSYTTGTTNPALASFTNTAYLGNSPYGRYNGAMDEVAIFNQSLTPAQISGLLAAAQTGLPVVALTAPTNGSAFNAASNITLTASVTTNGYHTVEKVQFFTNATLLAESTTPPYQFTWSGAAAGTYTLLAQLDYDGGSVLSSSPATITVTNAVSVSTSPTNILATVIGNSLILSWPSDHTGWTLQAQTNPPSLGLSTNWVDMPGSTSVSTVTNAIDPANGSVFYRLKYTP
jgi:subtilase family serine protease